MKTQATMKGKTLQPFFHRRDGSIFDPGGRMVLSSGVFLIAYFGHGHGPIPE
jgi:hypothetical protein